MQEPLSVDPVHLFMTSDHLDMRASEHIENHRVAHANIEAAAPGWVGTSAADLRGKLVHLQSVAAHVRGELEHHRDAFRIVGERYQTLDEEAAADIIRVRPSL